MSGMMDFQLDFIRPAIPRQVFTDKGFSLVIACYLFGLFINVDQNRFLMTLKQIPGSCVLFIECPAEAPLMCCMIWGRFPEGFLSNK
jgi:hypothetical protein